PLALVLLAQAIAPAPRPVQNVRVTARIVVIEQGSFTRAGLDYAVLGNDRVRVGGNDRGSKRGVRVQVGTHGITAFLEAVRASKWIRSESTQSVLTISGGDAMISSTDLSMGRRSARTRGPSLLVTPTVLEDGRIHLHVATGLRDQADYWWGRVDGSPAAVETEIVARPGVELILASSSAVQTTRSSGILSWGGGDEARQVLVVVTTELQ
ncbi:MAG TPA: hypothetical protein VGD27_16370, partial [Longimicrobiales bacterium]